MEQLDKWLMRLAGLLLVSVGALKIISAFSGVRYLLQIDPVLSFLSIKSVLVLAGSVEIGLAAVILLRPQIWEARCGLLSLCIMFSVYRVGMIALGVPSPCPCLGRASDWLHLTPHAVDTIALSLLVTFSLIGITSFATHVRNSVLRRAAGTQNIK